MRRTISTIAVVALALSVAIAAWAIVARRHSPPAPHVSALPNLFNDFQLVQDGLPSEPVQTHDTPLPLPARYQAGHRYIFHNLHAPHDYTFYKQLLDRFRSNGFDVRGSFSADDPGQREPTRHGDVIFRIVFRDASYSGYLEKRLDLSFPKRDYFDDYVLVIEGAQSSTAANKSDASGGSVFRIMIGPAMLE
jgi:hypothetical protein